MAIGACIFIFASIFVIGLLVTGDYQGESYYRGNYLDGSMKDEGFHPNWHKLAWFTILAVIGLFAMIFPGKTRLTVIKDDKGLRLIQDKESAFFEHGEIIKIRKLKEYGVLKELEIQHAKGRFRFGKGFGKGKLTRMYGFLRSRGV